MPIDFSALDLTARPQVMIQQGNASALRDDTAGENTQEGPTKAWEANVYAYRDAHTFELSAEELDSIMAYAEWASSSAVPKSLADHMAKLYEQEDKAKAAVKKLENMAFKWIGTEWVKAANNVVTQTTRSDIDAARQTLERYNREQIETMQQAVNRYVSDQITGTVTSGIAAATGASTAARFNSYGTNALQAVPRDNLWDAAFALRNVRHDDGYDARVAGRQWVARPSLTASQNNDVVQLVRRLTDIYGAATRVIEQRTAEHAIRVFSTDATVRAEAVRLYGVHIGGYAGSGPTTSAISPDLLRREMERLRQWVRGRRVTRSVVQDYLRAGTLTVQTQEALLNEWDREQEERSRSYTFDTWRGVRF